MSGHCGRGICRHADMTEVHARIRKQGNTCNMAVNFHWEKNRRGSGVRFYIKTQLLKASIIFIIFTGVLELH